MCVDERLDGSALFPSAIIFYYCLALVRYLFNAVIINEKNMFFFVCSVLLMIGNQQLCYFSITYLSYL